MDISVTATPNTSLDVSLFSVEKDQSKLQPANRQDAMAILDWIDGLQCCLIRVTLKTIAVAYISFFGPILEEYIFRDFHWVSAFEGEGILSRVQRIGGNAVWFGACHLSPFQGAANVSIFLFTSVLGVQYALLREITGGRLLSTVCHITHNSLTMLRYFQWIK